MIMRQKQSFHLSGGGWRWAAIVAMKAEQKGMRSQFRFLFCIKRNQIVFVGS